MGVTEEELAEEMTPDVDAPNGDDTPDDDGDGTTEDEYPTAERAPAPRSQAEVDALMDKLSREAERHEKRVAEIMGEDFALLAPNPTDWTPGYIFNVPGMQPDTEQVDALMALLGQSGGVELLDATDTQPCEGCNALGIVRTGSRAQGQETKPCSACQGKGWQPKLELPTAPSAPPLVTPPQPQPPNGTALAGGQDAWQRPPGHPHWGIPPALVTG